mmetsp:Transcript_1229/g.1890  ORF Transcript_1229/g.1890 Transcript_1229/m.1890 type:complete len:121 (-) Transcript_1229:187-549(-)
MPRLNMVRIKADHAVASDLRSNMVKSAKRGSGEAAVESSSFLMNDKEKLRMLKPLENNRKMLASVAEKTGASALIASYFGSTECASGNTSDQRRNIEVCNVDSDESSEFEDRKIATSIFS